MSSSTTIVSSKRIEIEYPCMINPSFQPSPAPQSTNKCYLSSFSTPCVYESRIHSVYANPSTTTLGHETTGDCFPFQCVFVPIASDSFQTIHSILFINERIPFWNNVSCFLRFHPQDHVDDLISPYPLLNNQITLCNTLPNPIQSIFVP